LNLPQADIVIANIIARPLIMLKPVLLQCLKPDGVLVLAGILTAQADVVAASYLPELQRQRQWQQDDWVCLELTRC
jgi:ribosomal protein L11 methyltransferase